MYLLKDYEIVAEVDGLIRVLQRTESSPEVGYTEDYKEYRQKKLEKEKLENESPIENDSNAENSNDDNSSVENSNDDNSNVENSGEENYDE